MGTTEKNAEFFTFPVVLLKPSFSNIKTVCSNIINYSVFAHSKKLELGTELERFKASANYFKVSFPNEKASLSSSKILFNSLSGGLPMSSIYIKLVWQFIDEDKSEFEIACLLAFAALKSIIGTKPYVKTTNEYLIARMGGYASIADVPEQLPKPLAVFATRRNLDRIKIELRMNWRINIYSRKDIRGFYVSQDAKFSLDKLALEAEKARRIYNEKIIKEKTEQARNNALQQLNN